MGQVRHGSATTTYAVRAAIQRSQASLATLSRDLGINPKTVAKWRKRQTIEDLKTGLKEPRSTVLTEDEEATIVAFRRLTLLPVDDCLYALQPSTPYLTRSALHRCLQRHGISRLPDVGGDKPKRQKFKRYPIGFFHIDIAEVQTAEGKLFLFVGIDRTSKFAVTQLVDKADRKTAWEFLQHMLEAVPYQVHTILTDNGKEFTDRLFGLRRRGRTGNHDFDRLCADLGIEHRLAPPMHPQTNGMVERFNGRIEDVLQSHRFRSGEDLEQTILRYVRLYNGQLPQSVLKGRTPIDALKDWQKQRPDLFRKRPYNHVGCDTYVPRCMTCKTGGCNEREP